MIDLEIPLQRLTLVVSGVWCSVFKIGRHKSFSSSNITYCFGELVIIFEIGQKLSSSVEKEDKPDIKYCQGFAEKKQVSTRGSQAITFIEIKRATTAFCDIVKHDAFQFALQPSLVQ